MSADFINCSSLFSRLVTKLASEGQRQQFCQLSPPPAQCLCISGTQTDIDYKQKQISIKMRNINLYEYGQTKRFCKIVESSFLNLPHELLTSTFQEKIHESFQILKYNVKKNSILI